MEIPGEQIGERFLKEKSVELRGLIVGLDHNFSVWVIVIILIEVQLRQGGLLARQNNEGHSDKEECSRQTMRFNSYKEGCSYSRLLVLDLDSAVHLVLLE